MKLVIKEVKLNNEEKIFQRIFGDGTMTYAHTRLHAYCSSYVPMGSFPVGCFVGGEINPSNTPSLYIGILGP